MIRRTLDGRRVFVTGSTGFLGTHLVRLLGVAGADVHALRHQSSPTKHPTATWHHGDLLDRDALARLLASIRPDYVFHLAAYGADPAEQDRDRMIAVNVNGAAHLWAALPDSVERVVMTGSCREYANADGPVDERYPYDPRTSYLATKHAAVNLLAAFAREDRRSLVVLRPFGPYGPGDDTGRVIPWTIRQLILGDVMALTSGEQRCDFTFVEDHVRAMVAAATADVPAPVAVYNIGGGECVTLRAVIEHVADIVGDGARDRLRFGARPQREGDSRAICADITAARRDLAYEPMVSLADGLTRTVEWLRALVQA